MMLNRNFQIALIVIALSAFLMAISGCSSNTQPKTPAQAPDDKTAQETSNDDIANTDEITESSDADASTENPADTDDESGDAKSDSPKKDSESIIEKKPVKAKPSGLTKKSPIDKKTTKTLYRVIVASYDTQSKADNMAKALIGDGFTPYVRKAKVENKTVFQVQVGVFSNIDNYNKRVKELKAKGYKTYPISGKPESNKPISKSQPDDDEDQSDYRF